MSGYARINSRHGFYPLIANLMQVRVADSAKKNFDLNVMFSGIATRDGGSRKARCGTASGVGFRLLHTAIRVSRRRLGYAKSAIVHAKYATAGGHQPENAGRQVL